MTQTLTIGQQVTGTNPGGRSITGTYRGVDSASGCHLVEWAGVESRTATPLQRRIGSFGPRVNVGRFAQVVAA